MLTKDNKVVAFHEYSKGIYNRLKVSDSNFSYDEFYKRVGCFSNSKLISLTPLDIDNIIDLATKHINTTWAFHIHNKNDVKITELIVSEILSKVDNEVLQRLYFGIGFEDEFQIYNKNAIKNRIYSYDIKDLDSTDEIFTENCNMNGIKVVSIQRDIALKKYGLIKKLKNNNIKIMVYTENNFICKMMFWIMGVDIIETDNL